MEIQEYAARRARVLEAMGERAVAVIPSAPVAIRNNDVEHFYRQESDFYYLTGLDEPSSWLVLSTHHAEHRAVLFVRPRDPKRETWDGPRVGVDDAPERLGVDAAFSVSELREKLPAYVEDAERLYYQLGRSPSADAQVLAAVETVRRRHRLGKGHPAQIIEPGVIVHEHRLIKSAAEVERMRRAAALTHEAHVAAMKATRPGAFEYEVEAEILKVFRAGGSERPAYGPIVGSGPNATILHHRRNDRQMQAGEVLLIDAGAELDYYAADVTRTFPVGGRFSEAQRALYDVVLDAQEAAIAAAVPGAPFDAVHRVAVERITAGLVELGLIEGPIDRAIEEKRFEAFYMHKTSHWLGMDVHDVGDYYRRGEPRPLEPGIVLTVEPGIYVSAGAEVDARWRGIGIRIEDDILVTEGAPENLTASIPKDPEAIEALLAG